MKYYISAIPPLRGKYKENYLAIIRMNKPLYVALIMSILIILLGILEIYLYKKL